MAKIKILLLLILFSNSIYSQAGYPVDTSYTVRSAFEKEVKNIPSLKS
ncbi:MAG: hypothetical protein KDC85_05050 [Saprospiraceae bacterium]|nr:hypothetical protein [Saprospiraceae bacterium]MCB9325035.1 hypothetical protein [Lewinellaceae bacterium]